MAGGARRRASLGRRLLRGRLLRRSGLLGGRPSSPLNIFEMPSVKDEKSGFSMSGKSFLRNSGIITGSSATRGDTTERESDAGCWNAASAGEAA